jgi:arsenical pump membrane protein
VIIWRPRGLGRGWIAIIAGIFALVTGVVTWPDIVTVWALSWNAILSAIALMIIALILQQAGVFHRLAHGLVRAGLGRGALLFVWVILTGALVTALLNPYTTVLIWMPIVIEMVLSLSFPSPAILAVVFATGFIADTASLLLPISNPINLILVDYFHLSFLRYTLVMVPVTVMAILTSIGVLWFYFHRDLRVTYTMNSVPPPPAGMDNSLVGRWSLPLLGLLFVSYFLAQPLGIPVSIFAACAALGILALAGRGFSRKKSAIRFMVQIWRTIPWQIILFYLGMYILVWGLRNTQFILFLSQLFQSFSVWGLTQTATGTGWVAMILSGAINNLSALMSNAFAIQNLFGIDPALEEGMIYASIIGCNIGAKITPIGSLSTLLWLDVLSAREQSMNWVQYIRWALIFTIPVLFVSLLTLAIWLPWLMA